MDTSPRIIALYSSAPQQGKSTVANFLADHGYTVVKFASPLKRMLGNLLHNFLSPAGVHEALEGSMKATPIPCLDNKSPRDLLISLGTDWGRNMVDPDIWVNLTIMKVVDLIQHGHRVVIDDLRFPNEYQRLMEMAPTADTNLVSFTRVAKWDSLPRWGAAPSSTEGLLDHMPWHTELFAHDGDVEALLVRARRAFNINILPAPESRL